MREMAGTSAVPASTSAHSAWRSMPGPPARARAAGGGFAERDLGALEHRGHVAGQQQAQVGGARLGAPDRVGAASPQRHGPDRADQQHEQQAGRGHLQPQTPRRALPSWLAEHRLLAHRDKVDRLAARHAYPVAYPQRGRDRGAGALRAGRAGRLAAARTIRSPAPLIARHETPPRPPETLPCTTPSLPARRSLLCALALGGVARARPPNRPPHAALAGRPADAGNGSARLGRRRTRPPSCAAG